MRSVAFAFSITLMFSGCSSTLRLNSAEDANRKIGGSAATMHLNSGVAYEGRQVEVGKDSVRFVDQDSACLRQFPIRDIRSIQVTHRAGGVLEGLLFGGLGGCMTGGIFLSVFGRGGDGAGGGVALLALTVAGGTGGLILGAVKGHVYTFTFPNDSVVAGNRTIAPPAE
jgi:uncharacterized protein YceK